MLRTDKLSDYLFGPDTSRLLAEVIGTAVDRAIQIALKGKRKLESKTTWRNAFRR